MGDIIGWKFHTHTRTRIRARSQIERSLFLDSC